MSTDPLRQSLVDDLIRTGVQQADAILMVDARQSVFGLLGAKQVIMSDIDVIGRGVDVPRVIAWASAGVDTSELAAADAPVRSLSRHELAEAIEMGVTKSTLALAANAGVGFAVVRAVEALVCGSSWRLRLFQMAADGALSLEDLAFASRFTLAARPPVDLPGRKPHHDLLELPAGSARQAYLVVFLRDADQDEAWRVAREIGPHPWGATAVQFILDQGQTYDEALQSSELLERAPAAR